MSDKTSATQLIEWKSTDGEQRCLLLVTDNDKTAKDVGHKKLEVCTMGEKKWKTDQKMDFVKKITNVGVPESFST